MTLNYSTTPPLFPLTPMGAVCGMYNEPSRYMKSFRHVSLLLFAPSTLLFSRFNETHFSHPKLPPFKTTRCTPPQFPSFGSSPLAPSPLQSPLALWLCFSASCIWFSLIRDLSHLFLYHFALRRTRTFLGVNSTRVSPLGLYSTTVGLLRVRGIGMYVSYPF